MQEKYKSMSNVPNLRFPEFDEEWEVKKLSDLGDFTGGGTPSSSNANFWNGDIPWVSSSDLDENNTHTIRIKRFITKEAVDKSATKLCLAPVILIVSRVGVGKVAYSTENICTSQDFTNITNIKCDGQFLSYLLSVVMKKEASNTQGTSIKGITSSEIKSKKIFIPENFEQLKIANFLSLIDERISTQNKIIEELKVLKSSISKKIFSQKLRFKDENGNDFPNWEDKLGSEVFESITNKKHLSDLPILAITQEYGAIPRDLIDYQISVTDKSVESYKVVEVGDFIISLRSFQGGIEYSNYKGICSPAYIILRNKIEIDNRFYKYYLKADSYIKLLNKKLEGIRDGKMISYAYFSEINLPFPCMEEQTKIANFLSSIDKKIEVENLFLKQLKIQKQYLLSNLFI